MRADVTVSTDENRCQHVCVNAVNMCAVVRYQTKVTAPSTRDLMAGLPTNAAGDERANAADEDPANSAFWSNAAEAMRDGRLSTLTAANRPFHAAPATNLLRDEALGALSRSGTVLTAHLQLMQIGDDDVRTLGHHGLPSVLTTLQLARNRITAASLPALSAAALAPGSSLTSLNLSANPLGADLAPLGRAIAHSRLETLNLSETQTSGEGLIAMARAMCEGHEEVSCPLRTLHLLGNRISDEAVAGLVAPLAIAGLRELQLGRNAFGDVGAAALARGLTHVDAAGLLDSPLRKLGLMGNAVGDAGACAFGEALAASCPLESLNLGHNRVGARGVAALADGVRHNARISSLDVGVNPATAKNANAASTQAARALSELMSSASKSRRKTNAFLRAARLVLLANHAPQPSDAPLGKLPHPVIISILELCAAHYGTAINQLVTGQ